jgi:hypothetical protein
LLGTMIAVVGIDLTYLPWKVCRLLNQPHWRLLRVVLIPLLLPSATMIALIAVGHSLTSHGLLILPIVGVAVAGYVAVLWYSSTLHRLRDQARASVA